MGREKYVLVKDNASIYERGGYFKRERNKYTASEFAQMNYMYIRQIGRLSMKVSSRIDAVLSDLGAGYCFMHVTDGSGTLCCRERYVYKLKKGSVLLMKSDQMLSIETAEEGFSANVIEFNSLNLCNILKHLFGKEYEALYLQTSNDEYYQCIYDALLNLMDESSKENEIWIYESLLSMLVRFQKNHTVYQQIDIKREGIPAKHSMSTIKKYIDDNFQQKLSLQTIAEKFCINKFYMARIFKEEYGISVGDYLAGTRLDYAKYLLTTTAMSVSEIAVSSGFTDLNYFERFFRTNEHCSSKCYRELHSRQQ